MKFTVQFILFTLLVGMGQAESLPLAKNGSAEVNWKRFAVSIAAHGAGAGFDSWTSWQRVETNHFLADGGRFMAASAYKKAGLFAAISLVQVMVVKKWGNRHPALEKALSIANFSSAGMYAGAGVRNLGVPGVR